MAGSDITRRLDAGARAAPPLAAGEAARAPPGRFERGGPALRLELQAIRERHTKALDGRPSIGQHRLLRERREGLGDLERPLEVTARGHQLRDQADLERFGRLDDAAAQYQVQP